MKNPIELGSPVPGIDNVELAWYDERPAYIFSIPWVTPQAEKRLSDLLSTGFFEPFHPDRAHRPYRKEQVEGATVALLLEIGSRGAVCKDSFEDLAEVAEFMSAIVGERLAKVQAENAKSEHPDWPTHHVHTGSGPHFFIR